MEIQVSSFWGILYILFLWLWEWWPNFLFMNIMPNSLVLQSVFWYTYKQWRRNKRTLCWYHSTFHIYFPIWNCNSYSPLPHSATLTELTILSDNKYKFYAGVTHTTIIRTIIAILLYHYMKYKLDFYI